MRFFSCTSSKFLVTLHSTRHINLIEIEYEKVVLTQYCLLILRNEAQKTDFFYWRFLQGCLHEFNSLTIPYINCFPGQDHFVEISSKAFQKPFHYFFFLSQQGVGHASWVEKEKKLYNILCKYRECFPSVRDAVDCLWIVFIMCEYCIVSKNFLLLWIFLAFMKQNIK